MIFFLRDELVSLEQNFADVESERARLEEERIEYQVRNKFYYLLKTGAGGLMGVQGGAGTPLPRRGYQAVFI